MGFLENLKVDTWYKAITYLGGVIFVIALTYPLQIATNEQFALVGAGLFLFGVGRWKNHKHFTSLQNMGLGQMLKAHWKQRDPDFIGLLLETTGIVLLVLGTLNLL